MSIIDYGLMCNHTEKPIITIDWYMTITIMFYECLIDCYVSYNIIISNNMYVYRHVYTYSYQIAYCVCMCLFMVCIGCAGRWFI